MVVFSAVFALRILTIFTADRLYSMSLAAETGKISPEKGLKIISTAVMLDPSNAKLHYEKCEILELEIKDKKRKQRNILFEKQLHILRRCINLCPSWAAYHMHYALILSRMSRNPNMFTREMINSEIEQSIELKPYSKLYRRIYDKRSAG